MLADIVQRAGHQGRYTRFLPTMTGAIAEHTRRLRLRQTELVTVGSIRQYNIVIVIDNPQAVGYCIHQPLQELFLLVQFLQALLEAFRHAIETTAQLCKLILARDGDTFAQGADGKCLTRPVQAAHRLQDEMPHEPPAPRQYDEQDTHSGTDKSHSGSSGTLFDRCGIIVDEQNAVDRVLADGAMAHCTFRLVAHRVNAAQHQLTQFIGNEGCRCPPVGCMAYPASLIILRIELATQKGFCRGKTNLALGVENHHIEDLFLLPKLLNDRSQTVQVALQHGILQ